ncbi:MAG: response regulator transcription factor [Alphaproteobacteria bacterium]|nr:response regulator transcription factor [Alphaproteobacteria bacterium]
MTNKAVLHLVDDDEAIRHSASFMLRHEGFTVKTYKDGVTFLSEVSPAERGCVLLDVRMPVMDGLAVQNEMSERGLDMPVIILTGHGDVPMAVKAMKAGAVDFIQKPYDKQSLLGAIGKACATMEDKNNLHARSREAKAKLSALTGRERDVLERLVEGMTNKAIANDLAISARTVEIHRANLMEKLEAESLSAALKTAFSAGLGFEE